MKLFITLALLATLAAVPALAQQAGLVDAPTPVSPAEGARSSEGGGLLTTRVVRPLSPALRPGDWLLVGAAVPLRVFDYRTTEECLSRQSCREVMLPRSLVGNHAGFAAFEAGTVVATYYLYRVLVRHHHSAIARVGQSINLSALGWTVENNYGVLNRPSQSR